VDAKRKEQSPLVDFRGYFVCIPLRKSEICQLLAYDFLQIGCSIAEREDPIHQRDRPSSDTI
jgi:hypothetical protein